MWVQKLTELVFPLAWTVPLSQAASLFRVSLHPALTHLTSHHSEPEVRLSSEGLVRYKGRRITYVLAIRIPSEELQTSKSALRSWLLCCQRINQYKVYWDQRTMPRADNNHLHWFMQVSTRSASFGEVCLYYLTISNRLSSNSDLIYSNGPGVGKANTKTSCP